MKDFSVQINECESLLISLKDANRDSLSLLEQKKGELNLAQIQLQSLKYEQSVMESKVLRFVKLRSNFEVHFFDLD